MSMGWELMDDMNQTSFPPYLDWDRIIHNSISYLKPICCVGLRSGCGASALITDTVRSGGGADTMHPVDYQCWIRLLEKLPRLSITLLPRSKENSKDVHWWGSVVISPIHCPALRSSGTSKLSALGLGTTTKLERLSTILIC